MDEVVSWIRSDEPTRRRLLPPGIGIGAEDRKGLEMGEIGGTLGVL